MKKRKNILAILLAVTLMASAVPGNVSAAPASAAKAQTASDTKESEAEKFTVTKLTTPELETAKFKKGTKIKDMELPQKLTGKGYKSESGDKKAEEIKIKGVTWKTDYTEDSEAGKYTFTAQLPKEYELAKDVTLPKLTIEITDDGKETEKATEKTETKASDAKETEKKADAKAEETKATEKKADTKGTETKDSEKKNEVQVPEKKTEAKLSETKESEKKTEVKTPETKESEKKAEVKTPETKESEKKGEVQTPETKTDGKAPESEAKALTGEEKTPESDAAGTDPSGGTEDPKDASSNPQTPEDKESEAGTGGDKTPESEASDLKITAFEVKDAKVTIDEEKQTITILMQKTDADLKKLAPKVTVPEGTTVEPKSETEIDFSQSAVTPVVYRLTKTADGSTREYKATAAICKHDWTPATCTAAAVCKLCGAEGEKALGHSFAEATCTAPKTCTRCHITEGSALGHDWTKATCAVKSTCTRCKLTQGDFAKHSWSDWKVTVKATHAKKGKKERLCKVCGKEESKTLPKKNWIGEAENNKITGVNGTTAYSTGANITFKAVGDRMDNKDPIEGDVRYKPVSWTCGTGSGDLNGDNSYSKTIQFTTAGDYTLRVTYERQAYKDGKWVKKGDSDVQSVTLKITGKTITTKGGSNVKTAAATGDNSPILILAVVLAVSLLIFIWMAVLNVRRKRNKR